LIFLRSGNGVPRSGEESFDFVDRVNAFKCELLEKAFKRGKGNYKEAAKLLNLYPTYVYNLLQKLSMTHLLNLRE
jgi:DNA-binding NtrC family response regulator